MTAEAPSVTQIDHFFSTSAARLDRWRELNAKAQAWAADAQSGKPRADAPRWKRRWWSCTRSRTSSPIPGRG